ncbi:MAG TPA: septal ring lytic transglycosylase RlpA family protein [Alphaproteobacteria bacterium]|jgi:rare lipoprotein A|nr:septal ring lytic transglycosylase RlpA family protein [Alphaproteobacteria bacterium]
MLNLSKNCTKTISALFIFAAMTGVAHAGNHQEEPPCKKLTHKVKSGEASWYGKYFQGMPTANGEEFNARAYTAANQEMRFNTIAKVTNAENGKSVNVRINDRGPHVKGRIIDLSRAAANEIGLIETGTAEVKIQICSSQQPV